MSKNIKLSRTNRDILIGIAICILLVFGLEILAKFSIWVGKPISDPKSKLGYVKYDFNPSGYGDLHPNQDGVWIIQKHTPYHVQTNSVGLRNSEELNENDSLRILAIGDSFTFGPYLPNEQTWPGITEQLLRNKLSDPYIQILNAGIPGYTIEDYIGYYQDKGVSLNADIIILEFLYNDISDLHPKSSTNRKKDLEETTGTIAQKEGFIKRIKLSTRKWLGDHSSLYKLMSMIKNRYVVEQSLANDDNSPTETRNNAPSQNITTDIVYFNPDSAQNSVYWEQYESYLIEFIDLASRSESKLIIVGFPDYKQMPIGGYPDTNFHFVENIAERKQIPFLNLLPIFRESGDIENIYLRYKNSNIPISEDPFYPGLNTYKGDGHLSRYGNQVASNAIMEFMFGNKIILEP